jgi:DNA-binding PadR family transcriptional regulator
MPATVSRLWDVAVLACLRERPMHPYEIQRVLRARRKDDVLVLKRGSLYQTIARLEAERSIVAGATTRVDTRPARTTYRITAAGRRRLGGWLHELIERVPRERSSLAAALSFLVHLDRAEAAEALRTRIAALEEDVASLDARIAQAEPLIGRIHLLESDYARAMRAAELAWLRRLISDVATRRLDWDPETLLRELRESRPARRTTRRAS